MKKTLSLLLTAASLATGSTASAAETAPVAGPVVPATPRSGTLPTAPAAKAAAAATATEETTLKVGSLVTPEIFSKVEWVQGEAIKEWEPGKVYVIECWATWCGPCLAAIPHVNELYQKLQPKGLRVIGMNVWEDGKDKVAAFVKNKGDGMSYPVAYTGKGGAFETEWLKPAGVRGIPHTFVIKDGKVLLMEHPTALTEEVLSALLAGGDGEAKAIAVINERKEKTGRINEQFTAFAQAERKKDTAAMEQAYGKLKEFAPEDPRLPRQAIVLAIYQGDWVAADKMLTGLSDSPLNAITLQGALAAIDNQELAPAEFATKVLEKIDPILKNAGPNEHQTASRIWWRMDKKDQAIAEMEKAVEIASSPKFAQVSFTVEAYQRAVDSMKAGTLPDKATTAAWFKEAYEKAYPERKAVPLAPVKPQE